MKFQAYLKNYQFFPVVHLANDENRKFYTNKLIKEQAKIYFFTQSRNYFSDVHFANKVITGNIVNNEGSIHKFAFQEKIWLQQILKNMYHEIDWTKYSKKLTETEFIKRGLDEYSNQFTYKLIGQDIIILINKIYRNRFKNKLIQSIFIKILSKLLSPRTNILTISKKNKDSTGKDEEEFCLLHIYQMVNGKLANGKDSIKLIDIPENFLQTEILYLGKADRATGGILEGRIYTHEKNLSILGEYGIFNDEVLIFIFEIEIINSQVSKKIYVPFVEEVLIRYFMHNSSRTKNKNGVNSTQTWKSTTDMINKGFTEFHIELVFDDEICRFGTDSRPYSKKHIIKGKLSNLSKNKFDN